MSKAILSKPKALEIFFLSATTTTVISLDASKATRTDGHSCTTTYIVHAASAAVKKETFWEYTTIHIDIHTVSSDLTFTNNITKAFEV